MNTNEIIIVTGLGRCGTSLLMQMLSAAGITCAGTHPSYEPDEMLESPPREFIELFTGGAVKYLEPHRFVLPEGYEYRFIFLTRSRRQQSLSQVKWLSALGEAPQMASMDADRWKQKLANDEKRALTNIRAHFRPAMHIRFEDLIERAEHTAFVLCDFIGIDQGRIPEMLAVIRPRPHGAQCYPGLLELDLMREMETEVGRE